MARLAARFHYVSILTVLAGIFAAPGVPGTSQAQGPPPTPVAMSGAAASEAPSPAAPAASTPGPSATPAVPPGAAPAPAATPATAATPTAAGSGVAPLLGNLGEHRLPITTTSALAHRYFDEGLALAYGFNGVEAARAFRDATTLDPTCALCYWGIAYALGPNINVSMSDAAVPVAYAAIQKALELAPRATPAEQALIQALAARYGPEPVENRAPLDRAYADAMREVARRFPDDPDVGTLFAEALMVLTPWSYWTSDGQPTTHTNEIVATLEAVLARSPNHPGANHFYIHAVEASTTPERAVPSAERLERLVPAAGHLVHMPAHVYWRVGRYHDVIRINQEAMRVDESYLRVGGTADQGAHREYFGYYRHNIHFVVAGAQMAGQSALALDAARSTAAAVPAGQARSAAPERFQPLPLFVLVRFGRWADVLAEPAPPEDQLYARGIWHWARGLAYLRQGQLPRADAEATALAAIVQASAAQTRPGLNRVLLEMAINVLVGELEGTRGRTAEQIARLERAIAIQDALPYAEPPIWFYPVRQDLGAVLLQRGRAAQAEATYREDLRQYPNNGWSLLGLAQSLRAQGRAADAADAQRRFEAAWQQADVTLPGSRF